MYPPIYEIEFLEFNWLCKHIKKIISCRYSIFLNSCPELRKPQFSVWVSLRGVILTQIVTYSGHWLVWGRVGRKEVFRGRYDRGELMFFKSINKLLLETIFFFVQGTSLLNEYRIYVLNRFFIRNFFYFKFWVQSSFYLKQYFMNKWKANYESSLYPWLFTLSSIWLYVIHFREKRHGLLV